MSDQPTNEEITATLTRIADLLEAQGTNPYRISAYRGAADTIRSAPEPLAEVAANGDVRALRRLPRIGDALARQIVEVVQTRGSSLLSKLEAAASPEDALAQVPGVGRDGARTIVAGLGVATLQDLELAAHDGRLAGLDGFDADRIRTIQLSLTGMLSHSARRRTVQRRQAAGSDDAEGEEKPSFGQLLELDAEYRAKAEAGQLRTIAPKRFNPSDEAWLPVLEADRDGWQFTLLFSNTARAHDLGTTRDGVVIYYERGGHQHQATVVTATRGTLEGKRIVRGREPESHDYHGLPR